MVTVTFDLGHKNYSVLMKEAPLVGDRIEIHYNRQNESSLVVNDLEGIFGVVIERKWVSGTHIFVKLKKNDW